jgi:putative ABC transport system ATP-binding protein
MQEDTHLIRARSLARRYTMGKESVMALNGVDLDIRRGEFVALVGPSGSGKSTLLNLIGGLDRPSSGEIWIEDLELGKASDKRLVRYRRDRIGFIFQSFNLLPTRSAVENVEVPLMLAGQGRKPRRERALALLERVGLGKRSGHKPNELSGGEMQRVAIARALANNPILLLADEPTGNRDATSAQDVLDLLCQLNDHYGTTIIMVTHDPKAARRAKRLLHLEKGQFVQADIDALEAAR